MSAAPIKETERALHAQKDTQGSVRGACPSLAAPMETGDGLLARLNPVSGGITPPTLAAIAEAAARFGNGQIEVTARGSLQIRGLTQITAPQLAEAIDRLDIDVRTGVPVETGALAGLDPEEIADPSPLAARIRQAIAAAGLSARLGPKVSVIVDGGGRLPLDEVIADVRLEAVLRDGPVEWRVAIGGTAETARGLGFVETDAACAVVIALLEAVAAKGRTGRAKELAEDELERALSHLVAPFGGSSCMLVPLTRPPLRSADLSPGGEGLVGHCAPPIAQSSRAVQSQVPSPLGERSAERSGGRVRGKSRSMVSERHARRAHLVRPNSPIATLALSDGRTALCVGLPFGQATAQQIISFADAAMRAGTEEILTAQGRRLLAICPTAAAAKTLREAAATLGFITDPADPRRSVVACAGAPACASGHLPARVIAAEISTLLDGVVHVSGCAKQCARPAHAAFTLIGTPEACEIHRGDGREGKPVASVAIGDAAAAFGRAARLYRNEKKNGKEAAIGS